MYLDTSVVVKLYTREPDSDACERIVKGQPIVSSELLYPELWSALLAKERAKMLSPGTRDRIWQVFEQHILDDSIELVEVDGSVLREAAEVMSLVHPGVPIRTLDAIHLATYVGVEAGPLFSKDERMLEAARMLGLPLA